MKISYLLNESEKIVLYTDQRYFGADVPDEYLQRPSSPVPVSKLYGYEPDDKMDDPISANAVIDLAVAMKSGDAIPPIVVRKTAQGYQVLDGHHRMFAAKKAGLDTLDAVVVDAGDIVYSDEVKETQVAQIEKTKEKVKQESIYTDLKKKFGPVIFKADYDKAAEYLHNELVKISRGQRELPHGLGYYAQQIAKELQGIDYRTLIDVYKDQYGMEGLTESLDQPYRLDKPDHMYYVNKWATKATTPTHTIKFLGKSSDRKNGPGLAWEFMFGTVPHRGGDGYQNFDVTGEGDAQRVLATAVAAIKLFVDETDPAMITFTADKGDDGTSRTKLYQRMVQRLAPQMGFKPIVAKGDNQDTFTLVKEAVGLIVKGSNTTADVKPGETRRQAAKLGIMLDKNNQPPTFKSGKYAKNTSPNKAYNLGLTESLWAKYKTLKESTLEEEDLVEISQTPGAIRDWANSEAANGIIAGFEAEVVLPDVGGLEYDEDREADMSEDIRGRSISDVIEFFEFDEYGMGISNREAKDLRERLEEEYFEWQWLYSRQRGEGRK